MCPHKVPNKGLDCHHLAKRARLPTRVHQLRGCAERRDRLGSVAKTTLDFDFRPLTARSGMELGRSLLFRRTSANKRAQDVEIFSRNDLRFKNPNALAVG